MVIKASPIHLVFMWRIGAGVVWGCWTGWLRPLLMIHRFGVLRDEVWGVFIEGGGAELLTFFVEKNSVLYRY